MFGVVQYFSEMPGDNVREALEKSCKRTNHEFCGFLKYMTDIRDDNDTFTVKECPCDKPQY